MEELKEVCKAILSTAQLKAGVRLVQKDEALQSCADRSHAHRRTAHPAQTQIITCTLDQKGVLSRLKVGVAEGSLCRRVFEQVDGGAARLRVAGRGESVRKVTTARNPNTTRAGGAACQHTAGCGRAGQAARIARWVCLSRRCWPCLLS